MRQGSVFSPLVTDSTYLGFFLSPRSLARSGFFLLTLECAHLGLFLSAHSLACLELVMSVLDSLHLGLPFSPQSFCQITSAFFTVGLSRSGSVFVLSVIDTVHFGFLLLVRKFARLESAVLPLDLLHLAFSMSVQGSAWQGFSVLIWGLSRVGLVSSLPMLDNTHLDSLSLMRSFAQLSLSLSVLDFLHLGPFLLVKGYTRLGSAVSVLGMSRVDVSLSLPDYTEPGSSLFLQASSHLALLVLVLDLLHLDLPFSMRSCIDLGLATLILGLTRAGSVFSLFVVSSALSEPSLFAKSSACFGFPTLVPDLLHLGFFLPIHSFSGVEFTVLLFGLSRAGSISSPSLVDVTTLGSLPSAHSMLRLALLLSILDHQHVGFCLFLQSHTCFELIMPTFGIGNSGSLVLVLDYVLPGLLPSTQSFVRCGLALSTLDFLHLGFSVLPHSLA
eukprot:s154_g6.t1